jgi:exopolysaccharide biosynthesis polyprenyl glycosylphosphotransferase
LEPLPRAIPQAAQPYFGAPGTGPSTPNVRIAEARDSHERTRSGLHQHASRNLRRHVQRALLRYVVLVAGDLAAFALMRWALRAVRDSAALGDGVAAVLRAVLPHGILNGWQFAVAVAIGLFVTGNYGPGDNRRDTARLFLGAALATALPLWGTIWTRELGLVAVQYLVTVTAVWLGLVLERKGIDRVIALVRDPVKTAAETLLVGRASECAALQSAGIVAGGLELRFAGMIDVDRPTARGALGHLDDFAVLLAASGAEAVVVCGDLRESDLRKVVVASLASGCQVLAAPPLMNLPGVEPAIVWRRGQPLVRLTAPTLKGWQLFAKRLLDLSGAVAGLILLAPIWGLIAVAVKLDSRGAVLFGHRRLGLHGRLFHCYKFRSMHADADQRLRSDAELYATYVANNYKLPEHRDPRLTRVGRFLRKTSLDELPQLVNVLLGQMSLVGPRPIVPEELGEYGVYAETLLSLRPGLTGAWQVNGRSRVGYPDRAHLELDYVRHWSLAGDVWILLRTMTAVLARRGAF